MSQCVSDAKMEEEMQSKMAGWRAGGGDVRFILLQESLKRSTGGQVLLELRSSGPDRKPIVSERDSRRVC